jgi:FMN phosphatase YigB (HAD superfamily)
MFPYPGNCPLRGIVFDLDDTLVDLETLKLRAMDALAARGVPMAPFRVVDGQWWSAYAAGKRSLEEVRRGRWRDLGVADDDVDGVEVLYRWYTEPTEAKVGAPEVLRCLRAAGMRLALLSNGFGQSQRAKIRTAGLGSLVDAVLISDETGVAKPDAVAFRQAAERLGLSVHECAMVGDNLQFDCEAALSAEYRAAFWVPRDQQVTGQAATGRVVTVQTISDLPRQMRTVAQALPPIGTLLVAL